MLNALIARQATIWLDSNMYAKSNSISTRHSTKHFKVSHDCWEYWDCWHWQSHTSSAMGGQRNKQKIRSRCHQRWITLEPAIVFTLSPSCNSVVTTSQVAVHRRKQNATRKQAQDKPALKPYEDNGGTRPLGGLPTHYVDAQNIPNAKSAHTAKDKKHVSIGETKTTCNSMHKFKEIPSYKILKEVYSPTQQQNIERNETKSLKHQPTRHIYIKNRVLRFSLTPSSYPSITLERPNPSSFELGMDIEKSIKLFNPSDKDYWILRQGQLLLLHANWSLSGQRFIGKPKSIRCKRFP